MAYNTSNAIADLKPLIGKIGQASVGSGARMGSPVSVAALWWAALCL